MLGLIACSQYGTQLTAKLVVPDCMPAAARPDFPGPSCAPGGRLWNKPWGLPTLSRGQKENRRKRQQQIRENLSILRMAARLQPEERVRLERPLPLWQEERMRNKLALALQQVRIAPHTSESLYKCDRADRVHAPGFCKRGQPSKVVCALSRVARYQLLVAAIVVHCSSGAWKGPTSTQLTLSIFSVCVI